MSMNDAISVAEWDNTPKIQELARDIFADEEPGFQIEGVEDYHQLQQVFSALKVAIPAVRIKFNVAYHIDKHYRKYPTTQRQTASAHIDYSMAGLAVHHNISDTVPLTLATSNRPTYRETEGRIDPLQAHNIKSGQTAPGTLTVFSQGGMSDHGLLPTVHLFDRRQSSGQHLWTRYSNQYHFGLSSLQVRIIAMKTLAQTQQFKQL